MGALSTPLPPGRTRGDTGQWYGGACLTGAPHSSATLASLWFKVTSKQTLWYFLGARLWNEGVFSPFPKGPLSPSSLGWVRVSGVCISRRILSLIFYMWAAGKAGGEFMSQGRGLLPPWPLSRPQPGGGTGGRWRDPEGSMGLKPNLSWGCFISSPPALYFVQNRSHYTLALNSTAIENVLFFLVVLT